jgi:hypothetical protein
MLMIAVGGAKAVATLLATKEVLFFEQLKSNAFAVMRQSGKANGRRFSRGMDEGNLLTPPRFRLLSKHCEDSNFVPQHPISLTLVDANQ